MKVLYSFPDTLGAPGIGTIAYHQAVGLVDLGADLTVYCARLSRPLPGAAVVETLSVAGRPVRHGVVGADRAYRYHDWRVARVARQAGARFDLVHVWPRATLRTAAAWGAEGVTVVRETPNTHTAHAFAVVQRVNDELAMRPPRRHSHTYRGGRLEEEEAEYSAVDAILAPSEYVRRTFLDRGFSPEKLVLHRYGFDPIRFPPPLDRRPGGPGLVAIFAGSLEPRKGLHLALRAWFDSGAADAGQLVVYGSFMPGYRDVVRDLLAHPSVEVRSFTDELGRAFAESDIFLFPSLEEGSALVTYEAQACGCVLVVSDAAGARVEHLRGGLVHRAGDVAELTEQLALVNGDRTRLAEMRSVTLARAKELTWSAAAADLLRAYERILGRAT